MWLDLRRKILRWKSGSAHRQVLAEAVDDLRDLQNSTGQGFEKVGLTFKLALHEVWSHCHPNPPCDSMIDPSILIVVV